MALLTVQEVSVSFGGLRALSEVDIDVPTEEVTGLIGPNGAGKTTLFNVIGGLQPPTTGRITLDGRDITEAKPHKRARMGIARTFQRLETFGHLSVRDNVLVAAEMRRGYSRDRFRPGAVADEMVDRVGLRAVVNERVDRLPTGTARLVELARALATKPRVLLLDEPSSGLNETETEELSGLLRQLAHHEGLAVLLVEHDMALVMSACDVIHVLDFGRTIAVGTPTEVQANPLVRAAYLGEEEEQEVPPEQAELLVEVIQLDETAKAEEETPTNGAAPAGARGVSFSIAGREACVLELDDVHAAYGSINVLHGVSLALPPGKVFALLGPNGAGKSTTLKVASGQLAPAKGDVRYLGESVVGATADRLARRGMCTIPEGRGIFPNLTVLENLRMVTFAGTSLRDVEERAYTRFPRLQERRKQVAGTLSGGEQQMLSMARAMSTTPKVLMLDELSMGLAPLIVEELYDAVRRIAAEQVSILIVEQFAHEVLGVADAAAIMINGRIQVVGSPAEVADQLSAAYLGAGE